jgi:drug/metabolite transporter (DMT)-like permease
VNRKLKDVHFAIITFYHPIIAAPVIVVYLIIKVISGAKSGSHSGGIYFALFAACCFDFLQLCSMNIAFQNDSSGFVAILGYISVVYGFIADELIFNNSISGMELVGASLILIVCISTAAYKLKLKFDQSAKK